MADIFQTENETYEIDVPILTRYILYTFLNIPLLLDIG